MYLELLGSGNQALEWIFYFWAKCKTWETQEVEE